ncbi:hypothetical protein [Streptomyces sp. NPDC005423]|uniref:hypothetical protein n=1 Tax=Streptomyces sp. NPDC005423 TaxID=3155343 RepID=UPI00339E80ED
MPKNPPSCAILGVQTARADAGPQLADLNIELGKALDVDGLLRFQVLVRTGDVTELCVYWLWRDLADRDTVWDAPPADLTDFWAAARPLWAAEPGVRRFRWQPAADRDLCPPGTAVLLEEGPPPPATPLSSEGADPWLLDVDTGAALRCRPPTEPAEPAAWTALWQRPASERL